MPDTRYKIVKDGWGNRPNFQASYGLTMSPEDIEEGNKILEGMQEDQAEEERAAAEAEAEREAEKGNKDGKQKR